MFTEHLLCARHCARGVREGMHAWLSAKKFLFNFPAAVRVLEIQGLADMMFGPVASVRKIVLQ